MVATQAEKDALKVMRKGTRACRECRRRKIKCIYDDHTQDSICQECKEHNRQCTKQGVVRGSDKSSRGVRVQVARLESAVQRIARDREQAHPSSAALGSGHDGYTGYADLAAMQKSMNKRSPLFTLFNNDLFRRQDSNELDSVEVSKSIAFADPDLSDKAKLLSTISAIPTIYDVLRSAGVWWISWRDQHFALRKAAANMTLSKFVQLRIADDDPVVVSVGLMALAMALQHLRPGIDDLEFSLPIAPHTLMDNITAAIDQVILDTPKYMNNPEIVLLFMLRAKFHVEHNQLRKGWLRIRQGIHAVQALNLGTPPAEGTEITAEGAEQQRFVGGIYEIDRLMSMVLGFPYATSECFTDRRAYGLLFSVGTEEQQKMRALRRIVAVTAGHVNDRNAVDDLSAETTERIQNSLQMASVCMPNGWWDLLHQPIVGSPQARHESLMTQMWYWTVQTYLHMPFLIGSGESAYSESSKQLCMDGARNLLRVFNYLRTEPAVSVYMCNCDDFQGLLGAVTLLVGLIQDAAKTTEGAMDPYSCMVAYESIEADMMLIDEIKEIFLYRQQQQGGSLSKQGLTVLAGLTSFLFEDENDRDGFDLAAHRQKTIMLPYFGTITVELTRKLPRLGSLHSRQGGTPGQNKLPTPPSSIDGSGSNSSGSGQANNDSWWVPGQSQAQEYDGTQFDFGSGVGDSTDLGMATIGWNHWDHFMQDNELSQEWNPEWNGILSESLQYNDVGQHGIPG